MQKVKQLAIWQLGWVFSEFLGKVVMGQSQRILGFGISSVAKARKRPKNAVPGLYLSLAVFRYKQKYFMGKSVTFVWM